MAGKPNAIKLTQTQFFELCMWVKKNQNDLKSKRQKSIVVAKEASEALKFPIAKYSILKAMEATGVTWSPIKTRAVNEGARANIRTLTNAISRLYDKLGETKPASLEALYLFFKNGEPLPEANNGHNVPNQ